MIEQGSPEWHAERLAKFTASEIHKLCGVKGFGLTGEKYIIEKVTENLTGQPIENTISELKQAKYGHAWEPVARMYYEEVENVEVIEKGFKEYCPNSGASPDGLIPDLKKGIEIKCPYNYVNHTLNLLIRNQEQLLKNHRDYYIQIQFNMMAFNFDKWDFVSYSPHFKGLNRMIIINCVKDDKIQSLLKERLTMAIEKKHEMLKQIEL